METKTQPRDTGNALNKCEWPAGQMVEKEAADLLLSIAADYEHMAETMEQIAKSDIARSKLREP